MECPECGNKDLGELAEDDCESIITLKIKDKDSGNWVEEKFAVEGKIIRCWQCLSEFFQRGSSKPVKVRRL